MASLTTNKNSFFLLKKETKKEKLSFEIHAFTTHEDGTKQNWRKLLYNRVRMIIIVLGNKEQKKKKNETVRLWIQKRKNYWKMYKYSHSRKFGRKKNGGTLLEWEWNYQIFFEPKSKKKKLSYRFVWLHFSLFFDDFMENLGQQKKRKHKNWTQWLTISFFYRIRLMSSFFEF